MSAYLTTTAYAEKFGIDVTVARLHCAKGSLECIKIAGAAHGVYLIPEDAEIRREKRGRKKGWRKNNANQNQ